MPDKFRTEEFKVEGEKLLARIKELIHEGNIRKIIIKDKDGKVMMEFPMTFGVAGVLIAPQLAGAWPRNAGPKRPRRKTSDVRSKRPVLEFESMRLAIAVAPSAPGTISTRSRQRPSS